MSTELASAYLSLVPSLQGSQRVIEQELGGIDLGNAGQRIGKNLSTDISRGLQLQTIGRELQDIGKGISDVGGSLTRGITLPAVAAGVAVGGIVTALGWQRLASIDTAQAQLRGLGYTAEDVERISGQLVTALEGGMMTMGQATAAAAAGMAAGVEEGAELTRYIQLLDAAVVGGTGSFEEMNQVFARIQSQGKLTRTEFDMIEHRMPGFAAAVQDAMGVSTDEMYAMLAAGEITTADFLDIMDDFAGDMATSYAESWEGMVQNTWAWIGILGQALLGGVFEQSKESIAEFLDLLSSDEAQAWAAEWGERIGEAFSVAIGWIKDAIDWWLDLDDSTKTTILTVAGIAVALGPALIVIGKIASGIGAAIGFAGTLATALGGGGGVAGAILRVAGPVGLVAGIIGTLIAVSPELREALVDAWEEILDIVEEARPAFEEAGEALFDAFKEIAPVLADVLVAVVPLLPVLASLLADILPPLTEAFAALVEYGLAPLLEVTGATAQGNISAIAAILEGDLAGAAAALSDPLRDVADMLGIEIPGALGESETTAQWFEDSIENLGTTLGRILSGDLTGFHDGLIRMLDLFEEWFGIDIGWFDDLRSALEDAKVGVEIMQIIWSGAWESMQVIAAGAADAIGIIMRGLGDILVAIATGDFGAIPNIAEQMRIDLESTFNSTRDELAGITERTGRDVEDAMRDGMNGMRDQVKSGEARVAHEMAMTRASVQREAGRTSDGMSDVGRDVANGLAAGIRNNQAAAVAAARAMALAVEAAARTSLDTRSPSRVFDDIGRMVSQGLAGGIDKDARKAIDSVYMMTSRVIREAQTTLDEPLRMSSFESGLNRSAIPSYTASGMVPAGAQGSSGVTLNQTVNTTGVEAEEVVDISANKIAFMLRGL